MTAVLDTGLALDVLGELGLEPGRTPLVPVEADVGPRTHRILLKLEGDSACGSIKARTAAGLVASLPSDWVERRSVLVESTSGNIGVAIATIAQRVGVRFVAVVDPKLPPELLRKIEQLDAEIDAVSHADPEGGYLDARIARVRELSRRIPGAVWLNQYGNPANPEIHYRSTGPELLEQAGDEIDAVFVAVSTGGTLAGIARYLREAAPHVRVVGVDAVGSVVFVDEPGPRRLTGIGASRKSSFLTADSFDDYVLVRDEEAFAFCHELLDDTGLSVGGSSGAVLAACVRYLARHPEIEAPVCLCADTGENYAGTIFEPRWLAEHEIVLRPEHLAPAAGYPPVRFYDDAEVGS